MRDWIKVLSVMMGIFSIVTVEILPIGLLTPIASTFALSDGVAGLTMTLPGLLAAVAAPTVTVLIGRIDRRIVLYSIMLVLAIADFLAAAAPNFAVLMISRILVGITIGGFWSISAGLADRLVPPEQVAKATSVIFSAVPMGSVLGVPLGTLIGNVLGWRAAFFAVGLFTVGVFLALIAVIPSLPALRPTRLSVLTNMLRNPMAIGGVMVTFLVVLAHFGTYTYITPFLETRTHASPQTVVILLLVYGAAGVAGNFLIGSLVDLHHRAMFCLCAGLIGVGTIGITLVGDSVIGAAIMLIIWGFAYGGVPVSSQTWFSKGSPDTPEAASVVFTSSFQATIAIGALAGGVVVDNVSLRAVMLYGGAAAVMAAGIIAGIANVASRTSSTSSSNSAPSLP